MTTPAGAAPPARRGNVLTRKIGPLPTYGWVAIVGGGILVWAYFAHRNSSSSSQSSNQANASDVPDFINQVPVSVYPPSAPAPSEEDVDNDVAGRNPNGRSPKVKHQFHIINKEHKDTADDKKKTAPGARTPTGHSGGPARHVPAHPARKR